MVRRRWILLQALDYGTFLRRGIENLDNILRDRATEWSGGVVETSKLKKKDISHESRAPRDCTGDEHELGTRELD